MTALHDAPAGTPGSHGNPLHPSMLAAIRAAAIDAMADPAGLKQQDERIAAAVRAAQDELRAQIDKLQKGFEGMAAAGGTPRVPDSATSAKPWRTFVRDHMKAFDLHAKMRGNSTFAMTQFLGQSALHASESPLIDSSVIGTVPKLIDLTWREEGRPARGFYGRVPRSEANVDSVDYTREDEESRLAAMATVTTAAALSGDSALVLNDVAGIFANQVHRIFAAGGILTKTVLSINTSTLTVTYTTTLGAAVADGVTVVAETSGPTAEGGLPPYTLMKGTSITATMHDYPVAAQQTRKANAYAEILAKLERRLPARLAENLSYILLYGDGTTPGLIASTTTGKQTTLWNAGDSGDTRADALLRAWEVCEAPNLVSYMRKADFGKMVRAKDDGGSYVQTALGPLPLVYGPAGASVGGFLPVAFEASLASGDFLVIDHDDSHEIVVNPDLSGFELGYVNDGMLSGTLTVRVGEMLLHKIYRFMSYCLGQWNQAPA